MEGDEDTGSGGPMEHSNPAVYRAPQRLQEAASRLETGREEAPGIRPSRPGPLFQIAAIGLEWVGQLVVPGALLALAGGMTDHALVIAAVALGVAVARSAIGGLAIEAGYRAAWTQVIDAVR